MAKTYIARYDNNSQQKTLMIHQVGGNKLELEIHSRTNADKFMSIELDEKKVNELIHTLQDWL